jgi:hypothetical protein
LTLVIFFSSLNFCFYTSGGLYFGSKGSGFSFSSCYFFNCSATDPTGTGGALYTMIDSIDSIHIIRLVNFITNTAGGKSGNDVTDASPLALMFYNQSSFVNSSSRSEPVRILASMHNVSLDCLLNATCVFDHYYVSAKGEDSSFCVISDFPCLSLVCVFFCYVLSFNIITVILSIFYRIMSFLLLEIK